MDTMVIKVEYMVQRLHGAVDRSDRWFDWTVCISPEEGQQFMSARLDETDHTERLRLVKRSTIEELIEP